MKDEELINILRRKAVKEDLLDKTLGDKPKFGSIQDATRSLIDSDYNPEGTVLSRALGMTKEPEMATNQINPYPGGYQDRTQEFGVIPIVEDDNPYRDRLKELGISVNRPLPSGKDIILNPVKSKDILVNRLKELPIDILAEMLGIA